MAEAPASEALAPAVHKMITRSPPGHIRDVLANCRHLAGSSSLPAELTARSCAEANEAALLVLPLGTEEGRHGVLCDFARLGSRGQREVPYLEPRSDMLFIVDQENQECISLKPKPQGHDIKAEMMKVNIESGTPFQQALQKEVDGYVAEHFPAGDGVACGSVYLNPGKEPGGNIELRVYISSQRARARGYWTGAWTSQWRIVFTPGQRSSAQLAGIVEFKTHYAEDGNVHFRRKATKVGKVAETSDCEAFASELVAEVARFEEDFHAHTEDICETYGAGALKAMRRVLPISKERFDWRPIRHSLVRDMKAAAGKEGGS